MYQAIMAGYLVMKRFQDQLELEGERVPLYIVTVLLLDLSPGFFLHFFFKFLTPLLHRVFVASPFKGSNKSMHLYSNVMSLLPQYGQVGDLTIPYSKCPTRCSLLEYSKLT